MTTTPVRAKAPPASLSASADETPQERITRLEARMAELEVNEKKLSTEREILQRAAKYVAGEMHW